MKRIAMLLAFFVYIGLQMTMAQTVQITGTITGIEDKQPLIGATVLVKGTSVGVTTDANGKFSISVPTNATILVVKYVGMKSQELPINSRKTIDIELASESIGLEEVVVTALGISRDKKSLGYAVQNVNGSEITQAGNSNLTGAIQGKLAGIDIKPSSGMPGASAQIVIRGARSFSGDNSPLYVIDGMPVSSTADFSTGDGVTGADIANRSVDINPDDIETFTVLKGQAAAALYGIRASNGVIVITTKSGRNNKQSKLVVNISHNSSFDNVSRVPDFQTTYAQGNNGVYGTGTSLSWGPKIVDLPNDPTNGGNTNGHPGKYYVKQLDQAGLDPWMTPQVYNNFKDFFKTGYTATYNLGISQGDESGNFALTMGHTQADGIAPSTGMNRWNIKGLVDRKLNNNFTLGFNANYSKTNIDKLSGANDSELAGIYAAPSSYNLKGLPYNLPSDPYSQISYRSLTFDNPYWATKHNKFNEISERFLGNVHVGYVAKLKDNMKLNIKYQLAIDEHTTHYQDLFSYGHAGKKGYIDNYGASTSTYNSLFTANYDWNITENLLFSFLLGNELDNNNTKNYTEHGQDFNFGGWDNILNTNTITATESKYQNRSVGTFGNLSLSWKSILYLNVTGRNDVVSSMPTNNRSFFYPSVSLGLVASELEQIKKITWISYAKLRGSYAEVGQAGDYIPDYYTTPDYSGGWWNSTPISYPMGGINSYIPYVRKVDPNLKPQNTKSYEIGVEMKFFNNRFGFDYTYSNQNVTDQIFNVPLAGSTGAKSLKMNGGEMRTKTNEVILYVTPIKTKDFVWDIKVNYYTIDNRVIKLAPGVESIFLGGFTTPQVRAGIGSTYPVIYGTSFVRDKAGNVVVEDDPNSSTNGMPLIGPAAVIGKVSPDFILGGTNTFTYKTISLTAVAEWKSGGKMYSGSNGLLDYYGMSARTKDRTSTFIYKGVKANGETNDVVRGGPNDPNALQILQDNVLTNIDENSIRDNSFIKLREISLHYKYPKKIYKSVEISGSIYARNILLWTKLENFDPESSQGNTNMGGAFERLSLPQTTSYGFGLDLTF